MKYHQAAFSPNGPVFLRAVITRILHSLTVEAARWKHSTDVDKDRNHDHNQTKPGVVKLLGPKEAAH